MALNIGGEVSAMQRMTVTELRERYEEVFGEAARSGNKQWHEFSGGACNDWILSHS